MATGTDRDIRLRRIEQAWLQCGVNALERGIPTQYLAECRYAFYSGAAALLSMLDHGDSRSMNGVRAEVEAYFASVRKR